MDLIFREFRNFIEYCKNKMCKNEITTKDKKENKANTQYIKIKCAKSSKLVICKNKMRAKILYPTYIYDRQGLYTKGWRDPCCTPLGGI